MTMLEQMAIEMAARVRIVCRNGVWTVPSLHNHNKYTVSIKEHESTCSCPNWRVIRSDCKHILAVKFVIERDGGPKAPDIDASILPEKEKRIQNNSLSDKAAQTERRGFERLLFALCSQIEDPPQTRGRPRIPLSDAVFATVFKVYSTKASRLAGCDLENALANGLISHKIHPNKISKYMEDPALYPLLQKLIQMSSLPLKAIETDFASDSSGFATCRFIRWFDAKQCRYLSENDWIKAHIMCGTNTMIVTAVNVHAPHSGDSPQFEPLLNTTAENFEIRNVTADAGYLSSDNLEHVNAHGGVPYFCFKKNSTLNNPGSIWDKMFHHYSYERENYLKHYHQRSKVETVFHAVKAKFRDNLRSRNVGAMRNEVLCKFLCHNLCVVHRSMIKLGIEAKFWPENNCTALVPYVTK